MAIRKVEGDLISVIEIVSPGNKSSQARLRKFVQKTVGLIQQSVNVLVIDLFAPTPRDPLGIYHAVCTEFQNGESEFRQEKELTLVSYAGANKDKTIKAYVEPIALGESLPAMPLFLWPDRYINVDLEATYASTWAVYPAPLKLKIE
ncbi:MAG: DUF4058 family protein [Planctomycetes bacterium]|nr:DUF4058 family protein [Planctomycetota bacterium]